MANTTPFYYRYPLTKLDALDDYLKITFLNYEPPGFASSSSNFTLPSSDDTYGKYLSGDPNDKKLLIGTVMLPIPDDIKTSNTTQWGPSSFNPLQAAAAGFLEKGITDISQITSEALGLGESALAAAKTSNVQRYLQAVGIKMASNALLGGNKDTNEVFSRYAGAVTNSNIELIFTGVQLREPFAFGFDITPRSKEEAEKVKEIIKKFKQHSAAKKNSTEAASNGLFLRAPDVFKIEYMNGGQTHPYLNRFKICACNGVGVNYTGSGTYATYDDATPVSMQLSLTFQELTPIYAEDYDSVGGTGF